MQLSDQEILEFLNLEIEKLKLESDKIKLYLQKKATATDQLIQLQATKELSNLCDTIRERDILTNREFYHIVKVNDSLYAVVKLGKMTQENFCIFDTVETGSTLIEAQDKLKTLKKYW